MQEHAGDISCSLQESSSLEHETDIKKPKNVNTNNLFIVNLYLSQTIKS